VFGVFGLHFALLIVVGCWFLQLLVGPGHGRGCGCGHFLLRSFPFSFGSGCRMGDDKKQMTTLMTTATITKADILR